MSPAAPVTILLGSLEPSDALTSTIALLEWWRADAGAPAVEVVALLGGGEAERVRALVPTTVVNDPAAWTLPRVAQRVRLQKVAGRLKSAELHRRLKVRGPVYLADAGASRFLHWLDDGAGPVVTHLHGSADGLQGLSEVDRAALVARTDRWIVGAPRLVDELVGAGVAADAVTELPDIAMQHEIERPEQLADLVASVRGELDAEHGIPVDAPLLVGIGDVDWWSVPDAFVRVAWEAFRRDDAQAVHALWVADGATDRMLWPLRHDIRHAGLEGRVHVSNRPRPSWQYVAMADVLLASRLTGHNPVGLADAETYGTPVLVFEGAESEPAADGDPDDVRRVVPHLDTEAMAAAAVELLHRERPVTAAFRTTPLDSPVRPAVGGRLILDALGGAPSS
jgi:hypothetical protein